MTCSCRAFAKKDPCAAVLFGDTTCSRDRHAGCGREAISTTDRSSTMPSRLTRRRLLQSMGVAALAQFPRGASAAPTQTPPSFSRMPGEGKDTPKICLGFYGTVDEASMRRLKQIGVDYVLTGGPKCRGRKRMSAVESTVQSWRPQALQHDDLRLQRCDLGTDRRRRADRTGDRLDSRRGQGGSAGHRIQLLRTPPHGGLQRGDRTSGSRLHGVRLRAFEETCRPKKKWARIRAPSS